MKEKGNSPFGINTSALASNTGVLASNMEALFLKVCASWSVMEMNVGLWPLALPLGNAGALASYVDVFNTFKVYIKGFFPQFFHTNSSSFLNCANFANSFLHPFYILSIYFFAENGTKENMHLQCINIIFSPSSSKYSRYRTYLFASQASAKTNL